MDIQLPDGSELTLIKIDGHYRIDASKPACGMSFKGVAWVLDCESQNPSLRIEKGLGIQAVQAILDYLASPGCPKA